MNSYYTTVQRKLSSKVCFENVLDFSNDFSIIYTYLQTITSSVIDSIEVSF